MINNLVAIQNELKAPKSNYNSFGRYRYRSAEDILTAVKPLLARYGCQMTITDDVVAVGSRIYIKASVTISDAEGNTETVSAFAREDENKKGMDSSQITGTASSYARKYALNGLFLIDDTRDADTDEYHYQVESEGQIPRIHLQEHGNDKISKEQQERLTKACAAAGKSIAKALEACRKESIKDITNTQYLALMSQLGAVA